MAAHQRLTRPNAFLLLVIVLFLVALPILEPGGARPTPVRIGLTSIFVTGVYVAHRRRAIFILAIAMLIPTLAARWIAAIADLSFGPSLGLGLGALLLAFVTAVVLVDVVRQHEVSADTIVGGINVYLLLGLTFMLIHVWVDVSLPDSYIRRGVSVSELAPGPESATNLTTMIYFSFTTLTTLGYGDIVPTNPVSQMVTNVEAILGQLYVAIFIARLVAMYRSS